MATNKIRTDIEIISSSIGTSGLKLTGLAGTSGVLGTDASGNVIPTTVPVTTVVQTMGASTTSVMSQKAVTDTVDGLSNAIDTKADASSVYTKTEIDGKLASAMTYKGTVATFAALPSSGNKTGDVWNVLSDGTNYAWDGSAWDALSGVVDLSAYLTSADAATTYLTKVDASTTYATKTEISAFPKKYTESFTPTANVATTITHGLDTKDVVVTVYDATSNAVVFVDVVIGDTNTIEVTSTTTDILKVVIVG